MTLTGGCHCGAIRYRITGEPVRHLLCHCSDCRRHAGAPMVGWAIFAQAAVEVLVQQHLGQPARALDRGFRFPPRLGGVALPVIDAVRCTGCGDCLPLCPTGALRLVVLVDCDVAVRYPTSFSVMPDALTA